MRHEPVAVRLGRMNEPALGQVPNALLHHAVAPVVPPEVDEPEVGPLVVAHEDAVEQRLRLLQRLEVAGLLHQRHANEQVALDPVGLVERLRWELDVAGRHAAANDVTQGHEMPAGLSPTRGVSRPDGSQDAVQQSRTAMEVRDDADARHGGILPAPLRGV